MQAYDLITEGHSNLAKRGGAVIHARAAFERAIAIDPDNTLAYALPGDAMRVNAKYVFISADERLRLGKAALERALELDPDCAGAIYDELKARAITSNVPHYSLAVAALRLGYIDEGLREAQLSAKLRDAIGPIWARTLGFESLRDHQGFQQVLQNLGMV